MRPLPPPRHWPRSAWLLIAANAVPLWGVFALDWKPGDLLWIYWGENIVIGVFAALRMGAARGRTLPAAARYALIPFFFIHYGLFCLGHGLVLTFITNPDGGDPFANLFSFDRIENIDGAAWVMLALLLSHGHSFMANYLGRGEYRHAELQVEMLRPYGRILVMHAAVLAGGFLVIVMNSPVAALAALVLIKTVLDLAAHLRERAPSAVAAPTSAPD
jgi:hypothetical protein